MINFDVVKKTGLKQKGELEYLFGVSRVMLNRYFKGAALPRGETKALIAKMIPVLDGLVQSGKLPLPADRDAESRMKAVKKIRDFVVVN